MRNQIWRWKENSNRYRKENRRVSRYVKKHWLWNIWNWWMRERKGERGWERERERGKKVREGEKGRERVRKGEREGVRKRERGWEREREIDGGEREHIFSFTSEVFFFEPRKKTKNFGCWFSRKTDKQADRPSSLRDDWCNIIFLLSHQSVHLHTCNICNGYMINTDMV